MGRKPASRPRPGFLCDPVPPGFPMTFLHNLSPQWLEEQQRRWRRDPDAVSADWRAFFSGFELAGTIPAAAASPDHALKEAAVQSLLYRYRDLGHLLACTDPLSPCESEHPLLTLESFGLAADDLDTEFTVKRFLKDRATLREILGVLRDTYCRTIGVEFMHIQDPDERQWLKQRMERRRNRPDFDRAAPVADPRPAPGGDPVRKFPAPQLPRPEALLPGRGRNDHSAARRRGDKSGGGGGSRPAPGHGPPRPAQRSGQHLPQALRRTLCRVPGQPRIQLRRRGGRQVPQGLFLRHRYRRRRPAST